MANEESEMPSIIRRNPRTESIINAMVKDEVGKALRSDSIRNSRYREPTTLNNGNASQMQSSALATNQQSSNIQSLPSTSTGLIAPCERSVSGPSHDVGGPSLTPVAIGANEPATPASKIDPEGTDDESFAALKTRPRESTGYEHSRSDRRIPRQRPARSGSSQHPQRPKGSGSVPYHLDKTFTSELHGVPCVPHSQNITASTENMQGIAEGTNTILPRHAYNSAPVNLQTTPQVPRNISGPFLQQSHLPASSVPGSGFVPQHCPPSGRIVPGLHHPHQFGQQLQEGIFQFGQTVSGPYDNRSNGHASPNTYINNHSAGMRAQTATQGNLHSQHRQDGRTGSPQNMYQGQTTDSHGAQSLHQQSPITYSIFTSLPRVCQLCGVLPVQWVNGRGYACGCVFTGLFI